MLTGLELRHVAGGTANLRKNPAAALSRPAELLGRRRRQELHESVGQIQGLLGDFRFRHRIDTRRNGLPSNSLLGGHGRVRDSLLNDESAAVKLAQGGD